MLIEAKADKDDTQLVQPFIIFSVTCPHCDEEAALIEGQMDWNYKASLS